VLVVGDAVAGRRSDPRAAQRAVAALADNASAVSRLVLVSPSGGGTVSFLSGGGSGAGLSAIEQQARPLLAWGACLLCEAPPVAVRSCPASSSSPRAGPLALWPPTYLIHP
jgi:hypothetical protein